ncbi:hypothetical protein JW835_06965 [bacterium]|nr:hypothetical protein [bacterium]
MKSILRIKIIFILLAALCATSVAEQSLAMKSLEYLNAARLMHSNDMEFIRQSSAAVTDVGGITFDQTARPASGLNIQSVVLHYHQDDHDGERLEITLNNQKLASPIYDWMLLPVAEYVASDYYSIFSLFGHALDENVDDAFYTAKTEEQVEKSDWIVNYHPQLENTLLGLRHFQMDMLILYDFNTDLPKEDGEYILGPGEKAPILLNNQAGYVAFDNHMTDIINDLGVIHRSYVISDYTRDIQFFVRNDSLILTETPYFFCWQYEYDRSDYDADAAIDSIMQALDDAWDSASQQNAGLDYRDWLIDQILEALHEYETYHDFYEIYWVLDAIQIPTDAGRRSYLEQYTTNSLYADGLVSLLADMDAFRVDYLQGYSRRISDYPDLLRAINPCVWDAAVKTMRYAAFFRYVEEQFPHQWENFMAEINMIKPEPQLITPTIIYEKGNALIENILQSHVNQAPVLSAMPEIEFKNDETYNLSLSPYVEDSDHPDMYIQWNASVQSNTRLNKKSSLVFNAVYAPLPSKSCGSMRNRDAESKDESGYIRNRLIQKKLHQVTTHDEEDLFIMIDNKTKEAVFSCTPGFTTASPVRVLFTATDAGGLSDTTSMTVTVTQATDIHEDLGSDRSPRQFMLRQNYPNPFNPGTAIEYMLSKSGQVNIKVFNNHGKMVRHLLDMRQSAGNYRIFWEGCNDLGTKVASGIYTYSLKIQYQDGTCENLSRKMILMR